MIDETPEAVALQRRLDKMAEDGKAIRISHPWGNESLIDYLKRRQAERDER